MTVSERPGWSAERPAVTGVAITAATPGRRLRVRTSGRRQFSTVPGAPEASSTCRAAETSPTRCQSSYMGSFRTSRNAAGGWLA